MSTVFNAYARYYDLLYRDKDYLMEAKYVASIIQTHTPQAKKILELGCGTGAHAEHLARMGYFVHGIDISEPMLDRAQQRKESLPPEIANRLSFDRGDIRSVCTGSTYDIVISLFHVMSYQTSNSDLIAAIEVANTHLESGGLFLFDFWHGPAVLQQTPTVRVKQLENNEVRVTRIANPELQEACNIVKINYTVFIEDKGSNLIERLEESHSMRYLFIPEFQFLFNSDKWSNLSCYSWLKFEQPTISDWSAAILLTKK